MKKTICKIIMIIFVITMLLNNFCYADEIDIPGGQTSTRPSPSNTITQTNNVDWTTYLIIGGVVLIIVVIAIILLNSSKKTDTENVTNNK